MKISKIPRLQLALGALCVLVVAAALLQLTTRDTGESSSAQTAADQAAQLSKIYQSTGQLKQQADALATQVAESGSNANSNTDRTEAMRRDIQNMQIASGDIPVKGPGVSVVIEGDITVFELQDLINEERNAAAEAIAVSGVRVVMRSAITTGENGELTIDHQPLTKPITIEAVGEPNTLEHALARKGGLIDLIQQQNAGIHITVTNHPINNPSGYVNLPKSAAQFPTEYETPVP